MYSSSDAPDGPQRRPKGIEISYLPVPQVEFLGACHKTRQMKCTLYQGLHSRPNFVRFSSVKNIEVDRQKIGIRSELHILTKPIQAPLNFSMESYTNNSRTHTREGNAEIVRCSCQLCELYLGCEADVTCKVRPPDLSLARGLAATRY